MQKSVLYTFKPAAAALRPCSQCFTIIRSRQLFRRRLQPFSTSPNCTQERPPPPNHNDKNPSRTEPPPKSPSMEIILAETSPEDNSLLAPVHIPEAPNAILKSDHPATNILAQSGIVVQRQIEMMNLFLGFEQANRYVILDPHGNHIGYMAEHDGGFGKVMARQWLKTHRAFTTHVFDKHAKEVLRFHRPFSWFVTHMRVYDPLEPNSKPSSSTSDGLVSSDGLTGMQQISHMPLDTMRVVGEAVSEWAPMRRKYNLFVPQDDAVSEPGSARTSSLSFHQFAAVDEPFLSWDFSLRDRNSRLVGSVNRSFRGFGRELFTDTGSYALRLDAAGLDNEQNQDQAASEPGSKQHAYAEALGGHDGNSSLTLDQRAVMLATAVTIDYDYFSRHSSHGSGAFLPIWLGGGGEAAGGAATGAAGAGEAAGGAVAGGAGRAVGSAAGGVGAGEGAIAGAGTMAGYEAMQRGMGRESRPMGDDASPQDQPYGQPNDSQPPQNTPSSEQQPFDRPFDSQSPQQGFGDQNQGQDVWGQGSDPWSEGPAQGQSGGGEGGGFFSSLWDNFFGD